jgi:hypothetical protein
VVGASVSRANIDRFHSQNPSLFRVTSGFQLQKKYVDSKRADREFAVGELVALKFSKAKNIGYKVRNKIHHSKLGPKGRCR